ncbi:hypothetical protein PV783_13760 [Chitinophaga sp. CC14]|uniref:hypothetical protein n=1 Tax=Chitinophaga sp. CC14 TaxID=3029199 RepID=UPI003B81FCBB
MSPSKYYLSIFASAPFNQEKDFMLKKHYCSTFEQGLAILLNLNIEIFCTYTKGNGPQQIIGAMLKNDNMETLASLERVDLGKEMVRTYEPGIYLQCSIKEVEKLEEHVREKLSLLKHYKSDTLAYRIATYELAPEFNLKVDKGIIDLRAALDKITQATNNYHFVTRMPPSDASHEIIEHRYYSNLNEAITGLTSVDLLQMDKTSARQAEHYAYTDKALILDHRASPVVELINSKSRQFEIKWPLQGIYIKFYSDPYKMLQASGLTIKSFPGSIQDEKTGINYVLAATIDKARYEMEVLPSWIILKEFYGGKIIPGLENKFFQVYLIQNTTGKDQIASIKYEGNLQNAIDSLNMIGRTVSQKGPQFSAILQSKEDKTEIAAVVWQKGARSEEDDMVIRINPGGLSPEILQNILLPRLQYNSAKTLHLHIASQKSNVPVARKTSRKVKSRTDKSTGRKTKKK